MRKKILSDVILNIIASVIPIFVLQFIILPMVASKTDADSYGHLLTIIALMNFSAATLGNILNNSKLIKYKRYEELKLEGDFNILLVIFLIINTLIMALGLWYYEKSFNMTVVILLILSSVFLLLREYGRVDFRIKLNFKSILIDSFFLVIGYGGGFLLFLISGYWEMIYFFGFASSFLYIYSKSTIFKEPYKKTQLFKITTSQTLYLFVSGLLLGMATYLDRLLLFPLLGGTAVSVYFTATIIGKTLSLVINPIANVLLSYIAQIKQLDNKNVYTLLGSSFLVGGIGYVITIFISKPVLILIYPQYVDAAMTYIYITTLTMIITIISSIFNPLLIKFCDLKWQLVINTLYLVIYIFLSLVLVNLYGLMGFCIGILSASIAKLTAMIMIYYLFYMNRAVSNKLTHNN